MTSLPVIVTLYLYMGNGKTSTKHTVLEILRESRAAVSGEEIAQKTGVSRVSVWKAVQALQAAGYDISSGKNGYTLTKDICDSLYPWEFGASENLIAHFPQTKSTMIEARRIAECEEAEGRQNARIVTADSQTDGHGKNNAPWTTTKGSLACTIITKNRIPVAHSQRLMMAAQIAWAEVLEKSAGRKFFVRWPNDIWTAQGKTGGILDELSASASVCRWLNLGIGINITEKPERFSEVSDCVFPDGTAITRKTLLFQFWKEFKVLETLALEDSAALSDRWNSLCCDVKKTVCLTDADGLPTGKQAVFNGVNALGFASLTFGRETRIFPPGTVSFVKTKF